MERWCTKLADNKLKRIISLGLVCLMLTPAIAFATGETTDVTDTPITEGTDDTTNEPQLGYFELPEAERYQMALDRASFDSKEELLEFFDAYKFLCENDEYEMYYDELSLGIIIRHKESGAIMESVMDPDTAAERKYSEIVSAQMVSAVAVRTIKNLDEVRRNTRVETSKMTGCKGNIESVEVKDNGFKAHINYSSLQVSFDFIVTLEDDGVHALIPHESIEYGEVGICIGDIYVYALMGYTERGDRDGYMLLPDGNGAIVDYDDFIEINNEERTLESWKFGSGFSQQVYGKDLSYSTSVTDFSEDSIAGANDPEYIYAPYWGMVHEDTQMAVLAVAEQGDVSMSIEGVFNGVNGILENYVAPRFIYRKTYFEPKDSYEANGIETMPTKDYIGDVEISYNFVNGNNADYAGLAVVYRDKLVEDGVLTKDKASNDVQVRVEMLGSDREDFLLFKKAVTATTIDNVRTIIDTLTDNGVKNMMVVYTGWQDGGIYNLPVTKYDVDGSLGGKAQLNALAEELEKREGIDFYLDQNTQYINVSNVKTTFDAAKKITKFTYNEFRRFEEVYKDFRVLYPEKSKENLIELVNEFVDNGIKNVSVDGMPSNIFTYTKKNELYTKQTTIEHYLEAFKTVGEKMNIAMEQPFKLFWSESDSFTDMPLGNSMYSYETAEIPFLSIVLSGSMDCYSEYVNFEADKSAYFLKLATYGVNPSFMLTFENPSILQYTNSNWIYTSEYVHYVDQIKVYYEKLGALKALAEGTEISDYTINGSLGVTEYANGLVVVADYNNYLLAAYKDGKLVFGYNPQEEADLTASQIAIMDKHFAAYDGEKKVDEYIGTSVAKKIEIAVGKKTFTYSNGVVVEYNTGAGTVTVKQDGADVFSYETSANSDEKAGELNE